MIAVIIVPLVMLAAFFFIAALIPSVRALAFAAFAAWWWPWRDESAATLLAVALEKDDAWRRHGYKNRSVSSTSLNATIESSFDGEIDLKVDGVHVPLSAWDSYKLGSALDAWHSRQDGRVRKKSGEATARALRASLAKWKRETAAQEKAR